MSEPFLGEIRILSFNFPPRGWAHCNGQLLPINQNQALFALLGTQYGGNGQTTFALPDLRGRVPVHIGAGFAQGQTSGQVVTTLTIAQMPAHSHGFNALQADATQRAATGRLPAYAAEEAYSREGGPTPLHAEAVSVAGGGQAHSNMQPYLVVNFAIALQGIFPSRN